MSALPSDISAGALADTRIGSPQFALGSDDFFRDPYPTYHWLRTHHPIYYDPVRGDWFLTRHADILAALKNPRLRHVSLPDDTPRPDGNTATTSKAPSAGGKFPALIEYGQHLQSIWMGLHNPADHTRLRGLLTPPFTPGHLTDVLPRIQRIVDEFVDRLEPAGEMDLIADLAAPVAIQVISQVLGVPVEPPKQFGQWSREIGKTLDPYCTPLQRARGTLAILGYAGYFEKLIAARRQEPGTDFLSALIVAQADGKLSAEELLAHCIDLFFSGHESTGYFIGNAMLALLTHPDQFQLLRENPSLMPTAVEELLRYGNTIMMTSRVAHADVELGGHLFRRGDRLRLVLGAGNRDPEKFTAPDQLDLTRAPNPHLTFGNGTHYCLGAPLARAEAQILLGTVVRRLPQVRLRDTYLEWEPSFLVRGLEALPVVF